VLVFGGRVVVTGVFVFSGRVVVSGVFVFGSRVILTFMVAVVMTGVGIDGGRGLAQPAAGRDSQQCGDEADGGWAGHRTSRLKLLGGLFSGRGYRCGYRSGGGFLGERGCRSGLTFGGRGVIVAFMVAMIVAGVSVGGRGGRSVIVAFVAFVVAVIVAGVGVGGRGGLWGAAGDGGAQHCGAGEDGKGDLHGVSVEGVVSASGRPTARSRAS